MMGLKKDFFSRRILCAIFIVIFLALVSITRAQESQKKGIPAVPSGEQKTAPVSLGKFSGLVPGVDLFSSRRDSITPFVKPLADGFQKMKELLGEELPKGAFILCNTPAEKDNMSDEKYLRQGYRWVLAELSPEATRLQMMERIKAQFASRGMPVPEQAMARFNNLDPKENERQLSRLASRLVVRASLAALQTLLNPEKIYRSSRVEDLARSPLPDWLDIGLANYVAGITLNSVAWTKQRLEEIYAIEDLMQMNEPFVVSSSSGGSGGMQMGGGGGGRNSGGGGGTPGGGGNVIILGGGMPPGALPGSDTSARGGNASTGNRSGGDNPGGGGRGRGQMPQEMIDKMNFDNQSILVFSYFMEKLGKDKVGNLLKIARDGKDILPTLESKDYLGKPILEIEKDWIEWVKVQKAPEGGSFRMM